MNEFKKEEIVYDKYLVYNIVEAIEFDQIEINSNFEGTIVEGYEIKDDNKTSFISKELFEASHFKLGKINFSMTLELLKIGEKISRHKWDKDETTDKYLTLIEINQKKVLVMNLKDQKMILYDITNEDLLSDDYYRVEENENLSE